ncbi:MAG: substrate-binding domain-containing protein [Candidatus Rokuibacteriota bacterium]
MRMRLLGPVFVLLLVHLLGSPAGAQPAGKRDVILATTTSTQDSGLLDVLVPLFEQQSGYRVKTIAVGTGQSLAMGARGNADVVLVHAPSLERKYVAEGAFVNRRLVMFNDFVVVGPPSDPARIKGMRRLAEAFRQIAESQARFVSRGDRSGTHLLELALWERARVQPAGDAYIQVGQGMGAALNVASEKAAYTLTDRATYLALRKRLALEIVFEKARPLLNLYHVMEVNPARFPRVNHVGAKAFAEFVVSPAAQAVVEKFGADRFGQALFAPAAGKTEAEFDSGDRDD